MTLTASGPPAPTATPRRARQRRPLLHKPTGRGVLNTVVICVLLYLVLGPLLTLIVTAFEDTRFGVFLTPPYPWTGKNISEVFKISLDEVDLLRRN